MKKVFLIHGVNLNMTGIREKGIYGTKTLPEIVAEITEYAKEKGVEIKHFQSNYEGRLVDVIHSAYKNADGIIINPGAFTHYSYAIHDAISSVDVKTYEVHLSDIHSREEFRHISVIEPVCEAQIYGKGINGYFEAIDMIADD